MLRRMKLALAEAENKNRMNNFQPTDQTDSVIPVNQTIHQMSMNQWHPNLKNQNSAWQNSTRKGTVKADEDFEFQGFPKPPPQFFPPPPTSIANEVQSSLSGPFKSPNKESLDHQPIEIKRIPLIFKGKNFYKNFPSQRIFKIYLAPSPKSPDYKNEKTCVLDELKQKQELGITGNGPIYKKNRSPMLRRMKLALAHIENESDL